MKILVIIGSTRVNRNADRVKTWLNHQLQGNDRVAYEMVDLRDIKLPFYDEVKSVAGLDYSEYNHPEAVAWGKQVESADGFIFVTPEYNRGPPAVLKNAIDYAWEGWNHKPMNIISYSTGQTAGVRAAEQLRITSFGVKLLPLPAAVHIAHVSDAIDENGKATDGRANKSLASLTEELTFIADKLKED